MTASNLKQVFDAIQVVEEDFDLLNFKTGGVFIWPVMRLRIIRELTESIGLYAPTPKQASVFDNEVKFDSSSSEKLLNEILRGKIKSKFAIIPFLRRNQQGEDRFTKRIVSLVENSFVFGVGESDSSSGKLQIEFASRKFEKLYRRRALVKTLAGLRPSHFSRWKSAVMSLEQLTGGNLAKYRSLPKWMMVEFHAQRVGFKKLFRKLGAQTVVYVNAYNCAYIAAAKEAGAWVVEPQHGLLSKMHSTLSWSAAEFVDYQPDEVFVWGKYWAEVTGFAQNVKVSVIGWRPEISAQDSVDRKMGTVAFVSQPEHAGRIAQLALKSALARPDLRFILKLHPKDAVPDFLLPGNLQLAGPRGNAQILGTRCEFVVGVSSMALVEALCLGAKVSLIDLPGREHLDDLVQLGAANLVRGDFNIDSAIRGARLFSNTQFLLAPELNENQFLDVLNGVS